ncbi:hypothetical protein DPMN_147288 [Dreissena polymorpha]|uniref:Uncharacterized protein n=1 Tax=Dreissena polymorpha TaxID=45954 RepID=A0A9D4FA97_DREPO|nr:hypothetical protein DPMN_147288 [Dreissena polymorpha]
MQGSRTVTLTGILNRYSLLSTRLTWTSGRAGVSYFGVQACHLSTAPEIVVDILIYAFSLCQLLVFVLVDYPDTLLTKESELSRHHIEEPVKSTTVRPRDR